MDFALFEFVPDAILVVHQDGRVVYLNRNAAKLFGYGREEMVGKEVEVLIPSRLRDIHRLHRESYATAPHVRSMGVGLDLAGVRKDGSQFPTEISLAPMEAEGAAHVVVAVRDVTYRKGLESRARQDAEKLREHDEFLSIAAHELRNPVNSLHLCVPLLQQAISKDTAKLPGLATRIKIISDRVGMLVDDLLELAHLRRGALELRLEEFDLAGSVGQIVEMLRPQLERSGSDLQLDAVAVVGRWDRVKIEQVVTNLVMNAAKYGQGKPIAVTVRGTAEHARLTVEDQGIGIDPEDQQRVFRQFERVGSIEAAAGLGLGLYISGRIVEAHGGRILLRSAPGEGAAFTVELPRAPPPLPA